MTILVRVSYPSHQGMRVDGEAVHPTARANVGWTARRPRAVRDMKYYFSSKETVKYYFNCPRTRSIALRTWFGAVPPT